jgi:hypothetical protein
MKWIKKLFPSKNPLVFVLEYVTFCTDKEVMGVFDNDKDAYEFFLLSSRGRLWCEGDKFSLYVMYLNDYYWDGVAGPCIWQTINGTFFSSDGYRERFEDFRDNHFIYQGRESII